jgi:uncharacterized protein YggU (UPF0235/DUF167 family)
MSSSREHRGDLHVQGALLPDGRYEVRVNAPRKEGRANERTCELLAMYFSVSPDAVSVIKGHAQPGKLIRVSDGNQKF